MKFYSRKRRMPVVIIVSLIDILAILLIFVIVTTTFRREQPEIVIRLPESTTATRSGEPQSEAESLMVGEDGWVTFRGRRFAVKNIDELKPVLLDYLKSPSGARLALQADTKAPFGTIVRVIDILKEAGVKNLPAFMESPQ
jgi:biopolymer transport protein ExbD